MNRIIRLSYCNSCNKRGFNAKNGVVCGLTNELPLFEKSCLDYDENTKEVDHLFTSNNTSIHILKNLKRDSNVVLSSRWTKAAFIGSIVAPLIPFMVFMLIGIKNGFNKQEISGSIIFGILLVVLPLIYSRFTHASLRDNKLFFKRLFGKERVIKFSDINDLGVFHLKKTKFTTCKVKSQNGSIESFTILNSKSILSFENKDAALILQALMDYDKLRRFI